MSDPGPNGFDPRFAPSDDAVPVDSGGALRPAVAGTGAGANLLLVGGGALFLGLIVFFWLSSHRTNTPKGLSAPASVTAAAVPPPPSAPPEVVAMEAASRNVVPPPPPPPVITPPVSPPPVLVAPKPLPLTAPLLPPPQTRAPVLVVDLAESSTATPAGGAAAAGSGATSAATGARANSGLTSDEQFAARVETGAQPDRAHATMLRDQSSTVAEGSMIPAVLETALNSDLPGFARSVVSRDVRSFDGAAVLIPRGSRVIGEYRNAAALGQSRAFVIWTRILRPDGVSIQIGSPATDTLGRAGLGGSVDRHFLERFSGAVLLSVVSAIPAAISGTPSNEVVIGSSGDASGLAGAASAFTPQNISPTIKVPQGTPIRIFVARDLDFSPVQGR